MLTTCNGRIDAMETLIMMEAALVLYNGMMLNPGYYYESGRYTGEQVQELAQTLGWNGAVDFAGSPFYPDHVRQAENYINSLLPCDYWAGDANDHWGVWYVGENAYCVNTPTTASLAYQYPAE